MINRDLTIFERDVLVGALPDILNFDERDVFPFTEMKKFFVKHKYDFSKSQRS